MLTIKIPLLELERLLMELLKKAGTTAVCEAVLARMPAHDITNVLYHRVAGIEQVIDTRRIRKDFYPLFIGNFRSRRDFMQSRFRREMGKLDEGICLVLISDKEEINGFYHFPGKKLDEDTVILSLPGPGMEKMVLEELFQDRHNNDTSKNGNQSQRHEITLSDFPSDNGQGRQFERLAGFIGEGNIEEGLRILVKASRIRAIIIGSGRMGSWFSLRFAQAGVGSAGGTIIADGDHVESHNLDAMLLPYQAIGYPKAYALSTMIQALFPGSYTLPVCKSLNDEEVAEFLKTCDFAFIAVDNDAAAFGAAAICSRFHIPHIYMTGGGARTASGDMASGGELMIHLPGSPGDIACYGDYDMEIIEKMLSMTEEEAKEFRSKLNWEEERAGSSADILMILAGQAMMFFWGILKGALRESKYFHHENGFNSLPKWFDWTDRKKSRNCPVCVSLAGLGDVYVRR